MGLGFPAAMQPMNPMLATWMNINTDGGFTQDTYAQGAMTMSADFTASYGGPLQTSPVEFGINSHVMMNSMSMAPLNFMTTTSMELPTLKAETEG